MDRRERIPHITPSAIFRLPAAVGNFLAPGERRLYLGLAERMSREPDPRSPITVPVVHGDGPGPRLVERGKPLSASVIWPWQERWFEQAGLEVWTDDVVPHHINTSSFAAVRHARIAVAWVR